MTTETTSLPLRRQVYPLFIAVALAIMCSHIAATVRNYEPYLFRDDPGRVAGAVVLPMGAANGPGAAVLLHLGHDAWGKVDPRDLRPVWPKTRPEPALTYSSNDRSRWATIRALVDHGTYVIGYRAVDPLSGAYRDSGIAFEDGWQTVDKVLHPDPDPERPNTYRFYSSKPPLLPTLLAGEYWLLKHVFGLSLATEDRWAVIRITLLTTNALPLLIYLLLLACLVERFGTTDWGRLFVIAAACFGTMLSTFAITLNNHTVAACTALFALYPTLRICVPWAGARPAHAGHFLAAGFFAAFTAAIELPAASFAAAVLLLLLWHAPRQTLMYFVPAAALPVAGFFLTNYLAIERWTPAYGEFGGPWYEYEGSHWKANPGKEKRGIDWAATKESRATYAFNLLLGHHGLFALTPLWFLAAAGMTAGALQLAKRRRAPPVVPSQNGEADIMLPGLAAPDAEPATPEGGLRTGEGLLAPRSVLGAQAPALPDSPLAYVAALALILSVVVLGFYLVKTTNYGGWTNGPRWLMWLTPFWLLSMVPVVDYLAARRWGRVVGLALLAISIFSAAYRDWNPWRHPWIYQLFESWGWIPY